MYVLFNKICTQFRNFRQQSADFFVGADHWDSTTNLVSSSKLTRLNDQRQQFARQVRTLRNSSHCLIEISTPVGVVDVWSSTRPPANCIAQLSQRRKSNAWCKKLRGRKLPPPLASTRDVLPSYPHFFYRAKTWEKIEGRLFNRRPTLHCCCQKTQVL